MPRADRLIGENCRSFSPRAQSNNMALLMQQDYLMQQEGAVPPARQSRRATRIDHPAMKSSWMKTSPARDPERHSCTARASAVRALPPSNLASAVAQVIAHDKMAREIFAANADDAFIFLTRECITPV
jgi:hypothetical protein